MKTLLELIRVIAILVILGMDGGLILAGFYANSPDTEPYRWLGGVAVLVLIFVLYRNKLQFSGWYQGTRRDKLHRPITILLVSASVLLIISPFVLATFSA
ncbi:MULTISPECIES: hypothetical protein [unclassified Planococcus (in: firmicutes)]|uniref:hypothetical protein n=1 Tax=unclassified Planococcus (in: firmicutes) TaxID=2662419 RepID=UPI000C31C3E5|nr:MULTISPECIES: hypothetical protein [unclassified Planococcus (in: firmicutes)]AUD15135.1 hypothetical protein CW734_17450 [Planococcus sp. MB-3u-03]PKG46268.1 hypothetical protein CXF66_07750 [Planococcus sp. Urea-trap-24]PKG90054.1 hypothetical protein CXF91_04095 [Planococcus sp. Urea-3u-39]PKH35766.1 hypothetical protein CXF77_16525 [Planococcus sp. MB-3u-09]